MFTFDTHSYILNFNFIHTNYIRYTFLHSHHSTSFLHSHHSTSFIQITLFTHIPLQFLQYIACLLFHDPIIYGAS